LPSRLFKVCAKLALPKPLKRLTILVRRVSRQLLSVFGNRLNVPGMAAGIWVVGGCGATARPGSTVVVVVEAWVYNNLSLHA
jgi:hypothetical protein